MPHELRLFGQPGIVRDGRFEAIRLKRCALLLALVAAEPRGMLKETLAERLWAEGTDAARRSRLRRLVYEARLQLGDSAVVEDGGLLRLAAEWLEQCDLDAFLAAHAAVVQRGEKGGYKGGYKSGNKSGDEGDAQAAARIVAAARQPLLGALHFDEASPAAAWLDYQRVAQSGMCRRLRNGIVSAWIEAGNPAQALALLLADLPTDPLDEAGAEQAAALLYRDGRFAECMTLFQTLRRNLADELGLDAAPSFHRLAAEAAARSTTAGVWGDMRPETRYVCSEGVYLAYQVFGSGARDLLFIPGFISSVEMVWELPQLSAFLAGLARHFRIILFDRRGVGLSDRVLHRHAGDRTVPD
ncbi:alpha/beta hydrolase, partial [Oxalobacteraceae bacterium OM1]